MRDFPSRPDAPARRRGQNGRIYGRRGYFRVVSWPRLFYRTCMSAIRRGFDGNLKSCMFRHATTGRPAAGAGWAGSVQVWCARTGRNDLGTLSPSLAGRFQQCNLKSAKSTSMRPSMCPFTARHVPGAATLGTRLVQIPVCASHASTMPLICAPAAGTGTANIGPTKIN